MARIKIVGKKLKGYGKKIVRGSVKGKIEGIEARKRQLQLEADFLKRDKFARGLSAVEDVVGLASGIVGAAALAHKMHRWFKEK